MKLTGNPAIDATLITAALFGVGLAIYYVGQVILAIAALAFVAFMFWLFLK